MHRTAMFLGAFLVAAFAVLAWGGGETKTFTLRVVDGEGHAVEDASVWAMPVAGAGGMDDAVRTQATGEAHLPDLDPRSRYRVRIVPPPSREDLGIARIAHWDPRDGTVVTLPPGRTIRGTVVDREDRPASAALHWKTSEGPGEAKTVFGEFVLRGLPRVPIDLLATSYDGGRYPSLGHVPANAPWSRVEVGTPSVRLTVWAAAPRERRRYLRVRVTGPDGAVAARVVVSAGYGSPHLQTWAKAGRTALDLVDRPGEEAFVRAYAARDAKDQPLPWAPAIVSVPAGTNDVRIEMPAGLEIKGFVLDEDGVPRAGLHVLASDLSMGEPHGMEALAQAWSQADGAFRLVGLGKGEIKVATLANATWPASAPVRCRGGDENVLVRVHHAAEVVVRVVDEAGKPVEGAPCVLWRNWKTKNGSQGEGLTQGETDADGRLVLPPVDPTLTLALEIRAPRSRDDLVSFKLDPWTPKSTTVTLPRGFAVTIRVVDDDGAPVDARVYERIHGADEPFDDGGWKSVAALDAQGRVVVRGLALDTVHEFAAIPNRESMVFPGCSQWVRAEVSPPEILLRIPSHGHRMTVVAKGARSGQVGFLFSRRPGAFTPPVLRMAFDEQGVARLEDVGSGTYTLLVLARGADAGTYRSGRVGPFEFTGGKVTMTLVPTVRLRVRPLVPEDARALQAMVLLPNGSPLQLTLDDEGLFTTDLLPRGRYPVRLFARRGDAYLRGRGWVETGETKEIGLVPAE